ncbi:MAG: hypothetical protein A2Y90_02005 [Chloroflexi bacterium RBG_13_52_12]|nr:MAG: hypothetical protein A2Y90_02005 [Chloroflexi bacterium RBG_13_52_12]
MTIIEVTKIKSQSYMGQLMKKFVSNRCCLGLLRFFAAHPDERFSKLAIVHAIDEDGSRLEVEKALAQMVEEKILKPSDENGISFYMLTKEEAMRKLVINMALFDWRDWQLVLEHI